LSKKLFAAEASAEFVPRGHAAASESPVPLFDAGEKTRRYGQEWLRSKTAFDPGLAEKWKCKGMRAAASVHRELLAEVKAALITIADGRESRCVTADDAARWMIEQGLSPCALGNASGSLFRGQEWELVSYCPR
jgi:hypothetical protein